MLREELFMIGKTLDIDRIKVVDAQRIFHKMEPRNLSAALKFYTGKEHDTAHDALGDVEATIDVLLGQLDRYEDLPTDPDQLSEFCETAKHMRPDPSGKLIYDDLGRICCGFGKHAGKPIKELALYDQGYLNWMLNKAELPAGTKAMINKELESMEI
jgi:DNA polymerase-3 subunit epsilon